MFTDILTVINLHTSRVLAVQWQLLMQAKCTATKSEHKRHTKHNPTTPTVSLTVLPARQKESYCTVCTKLSLIKAISVSMNTKCGQLLLRKEEL